MHGKPVGQDSCSALGMGGAEEKERGGDQAERRGGGEERWG